MDTKYIYKDSLVSSVLGFWLAKYLCCAGSNPVGNDSKNTDYRQNYKLVPAAVCINGLTVTFRARWFLRVKAELLQSMMSISCKFMNGATVAQKNCIHAAAKHAPICTEYD